MRICTSCDEIRNRKIVAELLATTITPDNSDVGADSENERLWSAVELFAPVRQKAETEEAPRISEHPFERPIIVSIQACVQKLVDLPIGQTS